MTPEQGYTLAQKTRPGARIIMGPIEAREEPMPPLPAQRLMALPGEPSWFAYDLHRRLGFTPSLWAMCFGSSALGLGHDVTDDEWRWLHGPATLIQAQAWIRDISRAARGEEWLTYAEAAAMLGVSVSTIARRVDSGELQAQGRGKLRRVLVEI